MALAATAVSDFIATPPPAPPSAAAQDDAGGDRFQDHLDAADRAQSNDQPASKPATAKADKPDNASAKDSANAEDDQPNTDAGAATQAQNQVDAQAAAPPTQDERPAHAIVVQMMAADKPAPAAEATPATGQANAKAAQPQQQQTQTAQQHSAPAATEAPPAAAQAEATAPAQPTDAKTKTPTRATSKTETKQTKTTDTPASAAAPDATQQSAPPPTPQAAAIAPPPTQQNTTREQTAPQADVIDAAAGKARRATAPAQPKQGPPASPTDAAKPDAGDATAPTADKTAHASKPVATDAAKAAPNSPDFKDFLRGVAASANERASEPATASASTAPAQTSSASVTSADATDVRTAAAAPVASQVAREIVRRANGDSTRFELRLDPPGLGKIQVRLDVSRDHKVTAVVSADNPQALSDLSRGARDLQQALQSAGLDLSDEGLSFDLSNQQGGFAQPDQSNTGNTPDGQARSAAADTQSSADTSAAPTRRLSIESWRGARIDVMA